MSKDLPILDLDKALSLVSNNQKLADDLLEMLIQSLPQYKSEIKKCANKSAVNRQELKNIIHKIHGGLRYIGAPALEEIISKTDNNCLNCNKTEIQQNIELIFIEFDRLLKKEKY